jgi:hypothetical protein
LVFRGLFVPFLKETKTAFYGIQGRIQKKKDAIE